MFQPDEPGGILNILRLWVFLFTTFYLIITCSRAQGSELKLLDTEKLELDYSRLDKNNRDPNAPQYTGRWAEGAELKWRISILSAVYWDNDVHMSTIDTGQVKCVGWHWEAGLRLNKYFSIAQEHHSQHILDEMNYDGQPGELYRGTSSRFQVQNAYKINIKLLEEKTGRGVFQ